MLLKQTFFWRLMNNQLILLSKERIKYHRLSKTAALKFQIPPHTVSHPPPNDFIFSAVFKTLYVSRVCKKRIFQLIKNLNNVQLKYPNLVCKKKSSIKQQQANRILILYKISIIIELFSCFLKFIYFLKLNFYKNVPIYMHKYMIFLK